MRNQALNIYDGKKVFITGHTGFKGAWLALWLTELGAKVTGFALPPYYEKSLFDLLDLKSKITHIEGDVRDIKHLSQSINDAQPDFVFHLAAQALVKESYENPLLTHSTNIMGSANLLESVRHCPSVRSLVYITSDKCYWNKEWLWGYREVDELGGIDPYSASKACAELIFRSYYLSYFKGREGFGCASTRAGNVIGGGDRSKDRIVPDVIKSIENGNDIYLRAPQATRPWQHVLDPLHGYLMLGAALFNNPAPINGEAFNFGPSGDSIRTVLDLTKKITSCWTGAKTSIKIEEQKIHEATLLHLSIDKAKAQLKWEPKLSFDEAATKTGDWYVRYQNGEDVLSVTQTQIQDYMDA